MHFVSITATAPFGHVFAEYMSDDRKKIADRIILEVNRIKLRETYDYEYDNLKSNLGRWIENGGKGTLFMRDVTAPKKLFISVFDYKNVPTIL